MINTGDNVGKEDAYQACSSSKKIMISKSNEGMTAVLGFCHPADDCQSHSSQTCATLRICRQVRQVDGERGGGWEEGGGGENVEEK